MEIRIYVNSENIKTNRIKFHSLTIKKSIDEICHSAEITCPLSELKKVKRHNKIFIKALMDWNKEERAVTYILADDISATLNSREKRMTIVGRSYARDIIDSIDSGRIEAAKLTHVVDKIAQKYNSDIKVSHYPTAADSSPYIQSFSWENESVWQKLLTVAENNGYAIASSQTSGLYVWSRKTNLANNANHKFIENENIVSATLNAKGYEQFYRYCVKGNYNSTEQIDFSCKTKRVYTLNFTDENISKKELLNRAKAELMRRKTDELTIELNNWGLSDKEIERKKFTNGSKVEVFYEPKQLIPVKIPSFNIDKKMIIKDVTFNLSPDNFSSTILLVDEGAL